MPAFYHIFVSYSHKDKDAVRGLVSALRLEGLSVCWDETSVGAFDSIQDRIQEDIAGSRALLAWYSRNYHCSRPCQWELCAAYLCRNGERVLIVNPERDLCHIPQSLGHRLCLTAQNHPEISRTIKTHLARFSTVIGDTLPMNRPRHFGRPLTGSNRFVGRFSEFWSIHDGLMKSTATLLTGSSRSIVQLRGFGGVGKSLLAEEYALRFGAAFPGGIFWLKAYGNVNAIKAADGGQTVKSDRDDERMRQVKQFASLLQLPVENRPFYEIWAALAEKLATTPASLWVVDDVPSGLTQEALSDWISPHPSVSTLITTRDRSLNYLGSPIDVGVLSRAESTELLGSHFEISDAMRAESIELLDTLGDHALAVEVAACYLASREGAKSIGDFLNRLKETSRDVLDSAADFADALPLDHSPSIVATLRETVTQLSAPGRDLLSLAWVLAVASIPAQLITAVFAQINGVGTAEADDLRQKASKETDRLALSRPEPLGTESRIVHTLVARTACLHVDDLQRVQQIRAAAASSLIETLQGILSGNLSHLNLEITHARALSAQPSTVDEGRLLALVAAADFVRGDFGPAERSGRRLVEFFSKTLGDGHVMTHRASSMLGLIFLQVGDLASARRILEAEIPILERSLPPGHPDLIRAQFGLASACIAQSDFAGAQRVYASMRSTFKRIKTGHPHQELHAGDDIVLELNRSITAAARGDLHGVAAILSQAAEAAKLALGENHFIALSAQHARIRSLLSVGQPDVARQVASELIPRLEANLGPANPLTLATRFDQAVTLLVLGHNSEALAVLELLIPSQEKLASAGHPGFSFKFVLAQACSGTGDHKRAHGFLEEAIQLAEEKLGPEHPRVVELKAARASI